MSPDSPRIAFGPFVADPRTGELWRRGTPVRLQQQPARLLALLLSRPGDVVSRVEIRRTLWNGRPAADADHGLDVAVSKLRRALRDRGRRPRFIETLPGQGYRFVTRTGSSGFPTPPS